MYTSQLHEYVNNNKQYSEKHRYYHNNEHINSLFTLVNKYSSTINEYYLECLYHAILFHDIIYDPTSSYNEANSAEEYRYVVKKFELKLLPEFIEKVVDLIMCTKNRTMPTDDIEKIMWTIDNSILLEDFSTLLEYEEKIFKEYQFVDYIKYKEGRIKFLQETIDNPYFKVNEQNLQFLIKYINNRKIKVGLYAGSFNKFHIGHLNILEKAEKIFDKVIILVAQNTEKEKVKVTLPKCLKYHQVEYLEQPLTTDFIENHSNKNVDITLIRGLRNATDLQYEQNQNSYMKDIYPNLKLVYINCDKEYEHISSSSIRSLNKISPEIANRYLPE